MRKFSKMILLVFFLSVIYIYTLVIEAIPNELVVFEGENISMRTLLGITIKGKEMKTIETSSNSGNTVSEEVRKSYFRSEFI